MQASTFILFFIFFIWVQTVQKKQKKKKYILSERKRWWLEIFSLYNCSYCWPNVEAACDKHYDDHIKKIALKTATEHNNIIIAILCGWNYWYYKPNRAGVRFGVIGASSFLPGVQILIDLIENDEKTFLLQDVDLNRKVVYVTVNVPCIRSCAICSARKGQFVSVGTCGTRVWCSWQGHVSSLITAALLLTHIHQAVTLQLHTLTPPSVHFLMLNI